MRERFEAQTQYLTTMLKEYQNHVLNEYYPRKEVERLLLRLPTKWRNTHEELRKLKEHSRHRRIKFR